MIRVPYHRYLDYLILNRVDDIRGHIRSLGYEPPTEHDLQNRVNELGRPTPKLRQELGLKFFDEESKSLDTCMWIVERPDVRHATERFLYDGVDAAGTAAALAVKYNGEIERRAVEFFASGFWDVWMLSKVDFHEYFVSAGVVMPSTKLVPVAMRPAHRLWEEGVTPDIDSSDMIKQFQMDAYMLYGQAVSRRDYEEARNQAKLAMNMAIVRKKNFKASDQLLENLEIISVEDNAPFIDELSVYQALEGKENDDDDV